MKKLTSLQIMMLMGLSVGSMQLFGKMQSSEMKDAMLDEQAEEVKADLAQVDAEAERKLENKLDSMHETLISVERTVKHENLGLDKLEKSGNISEEEIAKHAVILEKAQKELDDIIERSSKKHHNKHEARIQRIKDQLMKAEQHLKRLNDKVSGNEQSEKKMKKSKPSVDKSSANKQMKKKCSKKKSAIQSDDIMQDEVAIQSQSSSSSKSPKSAAQHHHSAKKDRQTVSKKQ